MDTVTTRILENGNLEITIPIAVRSLRGRKRVIAPDEETNGQDVILTALARGLRWQRRQKARRHYSLCRDHRSLGNRSRRRRRLCRP